VWEKVRTGTDSHILYDSVRGFGNSKALKSNSTVVEGENDNATYGYVNNTFNGGIEIYGGSSAASDSFTNETNQDMVAWCWKAGGNSNTFNVDDVGYDTASAAGLDGGTITPTGASVNTKSGFSIITYTGAGANRTVSHGLSAQPSLVIVKGRDNTGLWVTWHSALAGTQALYLNSTAAVDTSTLYWNSQVPTSSLINLGSGGYVNGSENTYVAYCWAEIPGFSKFGSYTGNGSADGPFVYTGFRPRWVMVKGSTYVSNWNLLDTARDPYNLQSNILRPNLSSAESSTSTGTYAICWDGLSNGFKLRGGSGTNDVNQTNETYIYAAFAEAPEFNLYGAQSNAR